MLRIRTALVSVLLAAVSIADAGTTARQIARFEEARLQETLDAVLGPGRAKAFVIVEDDRSKVREVVTRVSPAVEVSRSRAEWRSISGNGSREQVVGEVSRRVKRTVTTGPRMRLSTMVLVDGRIVPGNALSGIK